MHRSTLRLAVVPALPAALAALGSTGHGQVVVSDSFGPITTNFDNYSIYFDLDGSGGASLGRVAGADFVFSHDTWSNGGDPKPIGSKAYLKSVNDNASIIGSGASADTFASTSLITSSLSLVDDSSKNNRLNGSGTPVYAGLKVGTGLGWALYSNNSDTITLYSFGFDASGADITLPAVPQSAIDYAASVVPEPSTYAALAGLLAGSAAVFLRRQQKKNAAASA